MDATKCQVEIEGEFCSRPLYAVRQGLCNAHYQQARRGNPFKKIRKAVLPQTLNECSFALCDNGVQAKGLCYGHYWQQRVGRELSPLYETQRRHGDVLARDENGDKWCRVCKISKPEEAFGFDSKSLDNLRSDCRDCRKREATKWTERNRDSHLKKKYGRDMEWFTSTLASQNGACDLCGTKDRGRKNWQVDHDHACCPGGESCGLCVRGILCSRCNLTLGQVRDSVDTLNKMIEYLEKWRAVK